MRQRRIRVLIYEGDEKWLDAVWTRNWLRNGEVRELPGGNSIIAHEIFDIPVEDADATA